MVDMGDDAKIPNMFHPYKNTAIPAVSNCSPNEVVQFISQWSYLFQ
jgi:hypothetical protein